MKRLLVAMIVVFAIPRMPGLARAGGTPAQCAATKMQATGKKADRKLTCWSNEVIRPGTYAACAAKAEVTFAAKFAQAEARGGCATSGDTGALEAKVDAFVDDVVGALTGTPPGSILGTSDAQRCARTKLKAAGGKAAAKLKCNARAATSRVLDDSCISQAETSYDQKWDGAERRGGCATSSDKAAIETMVDAFVSDATPPCLSATRGGACDASLPDSLCAPASPADFCSFQHFPGDICIAEHTCVLDDCGTDADCSGGEVCVFGFPVPLGCASACCAPASPYPCFTSQAPTCGGSCPSGQICGRVSGGSSCECVRSDQTCGISQAPTCGGTCPGDQVCGQTSGGSSCECVAPDQTCLISSAPTCGGTCPTSSQSCQSLNGDSCTCVCDPALPCPFAATWGTAGSGDGQFNAPDAVAVDGTGNVFVVDDTNDVVQKFTNTGTFLTEWGSGGTGDGQFNNPAGIAVDATGNVFVSDQVNGRIQKFTNTGAFVTTWGSCCTGDVRFWNPRGIAVDSSGNVFVADSGNHRIQKFTNAGVFVTAWGSQGSGDGQFESPFGVAVDGSGNVLVTDSDNNRIQKFTNTGTFLTKWGSGGTGDGQFNNPFGIAVDGTGNVLVADLGTSRIQEFTSTGAFLTKWGCPGSGHGQFISVYDVAVDASGNVYVADSGNHRIQKFGCP